MAVLRSKGLYLLLVVHSLAVFCFGLALFAAKWFPFGSTFGWLREWLQKSF
jgi:hypothetical protein